MIVLIGLYRCTSTGRKCDGYPKAVQFIHMQVPSPSRLSEKPTRALSQLPALGDSAKYLEFYHYCAVPLLSSRFDQDFWSKISLQLSYSEPAVRQAVIALGYLNKTESGSIKHARLRYQVEHGNKVFLHHYNQAVRKLVERMAEPSYVPEIGLVTCLLFICIEFLRGNYCTAFTHMTNGLRLIREWKEQRRLTASPADQTRIRDSTCLIEDVLFPMFQRGATSALLYGVPTEEVFDISIPDPDKFVQLPFSLAEAERASRELRNASILFLFNTGKKLHANIALDETDFATRTRLLECHYLWLAHTKSAEETRTWSHADCVSFSALKVVQYATETYVGCATSTYQSAYDVYLDTFTALLHHAEIVLNAINTQESPAAKFTFEISIIAPLYHTATRCRCPITRRKAISLLARGPPREGLWDAEQHVMVARRVVEMEESEVDPESGWPVERTRLYSAEINAKMDAEGGFWVYYLPSDWVGQLDEHGTQRLKQERFVM